MSELTAELSSSDYARQVLGGLTKLPEEQYLHTPQRKLAAKIAQGLLQQLGNTAVKKGEIHVIQGIDLNPTNDVDNNALDMVLSDFKGWIPGQGGAKDAVHSFNIPTMLKKVPEGGSLAVNTGSPQVKLIINTDQAGKYQLSVMVGA